MNVAVAGLGFMGATHLKAWRKIPGVHVAAIVSSSAEKLSGDLTSIAGNLGGAGERFDLSGVRKYHSLEDALRDPVLDKVLDAVDICLPTDRHESAALAAILAGKHVLLEKPMALDFASAERIRRCAEENRRILMVAQVLRFITAYRSAREWLQSAGAVRAAMFRRRCAAPGWSSWLGDKSRSGGGVFDLLIHDVDFCLSLWGMPEAVRATGYESLADGIDLLHAELQYPGMTPVFITGGWHPPASYPFSMDFTIVTDSGTREYWADDADPFAAELNYFADCVHHNRPPVLCLPRQSAQAVALLRFMLESREHNGETIGTV
jgi:predicted dehydrogenase